MARQRRRRVNWDWKPAGLLLLLAAAALIFGGLYSLIAWWFS